MPAEYVTSDERAPCPHCGATLTALWEHFEDALDVKGECDECGGRFRISLCVYHTYTITKDSE